MRKFLEGFFWEEFFGRNSFCQDFGVILSQLRRKEDEFKFLEVRGKLIALIKSNSRLVVIGT